MVRLCGNDVEAHGPRGIEKWTFANEAEARAKAAFVEEALSWIGTPFRDLADIKGPNGAVDCAMLLTRACVDTGLRPHFDPRPYPARHMMHSNRERFLEWVEEKLDGREVDPGSGPGPRFGDVAVWRFGKVFAHGAIVVNSEEVVHAYAKAGKCIVSRLDDPFLKCATLRGVEYPRPVKFFDIWRG